MTGRPSSIAHALLEASARAPAKPAVLFGAETWSYERLAAETVRWAAALRVWGLQPADRVALVLENSPAFLTTYLGIHLAGGIVVLVNTQYRQVELRHILSDAGVRLCVTDRHRYAELTRVEDDLPALEAVVVDAVARSMNSDGEARTEATRRVPVVYNRDRFLAGGDLEPTFTPPSAESIAVIGYTSGTTGRSKGAMLTHHNLVANAAAIVEAWHWTAADRLLLTLPLFHVHGLCVGIHGTLLTGSTVDLRPRFDAEEALSTLLRGGATMFFGVPTMYTRLIAAAQRRGERPAALRLYVSGSAPLSAQTYEEFEQLFGQRILERYGMTETLMNLTNPYEGERRPGTVGQPFPGQEARIVDVQSRQPILDDRMGEIQVRGPHVFAGYWQQPEATAAAFDADGWFTTGDLGWRSADGYYTISGRARELIISGGYNIYPREVEEVLVTHPAVAEAAVLGLADPEYGEQVVAAIVLDAQAGVSPDGTGQLSDDLIALCRDQLAGYKKPRRIEFVDALPRNALGKIQKHILRQSLAGGEA